MKDHIVIESLIKYRNAHIFNLDDVRKSPYKYFYEVTDLDRLELEFIKRTNNKPDMDYIEGVIYIEINGSILINYSMWDDINHLWGYLFFQDIPEFLQKKKMELTFPSCSIYFILEVLPNYAGKSKFSIYAGSIRNSCVVDTKEFLLTLATKAEEFYVCFMSLNKLKNYFDKDLIQVQKIKKEIESHYFK